MASVLLLVHDETFLHLSATKRCQDRLSSHRFPKNCTGTWVCILNIFEYIWRKRVSNMKRYLLSSVNTHLTLSAAAYLTAQHGDRMKQDISECMVCDVSQVSQSCRRVRKQPPTHNKRMILLQTLLFQLYPDGFIPLPSWWWYSIKHKTSRNIRCSWASMLHKDNNNKKKNILGDIFNLQTVK